MIRIVAFFSKIPCSQKYWRELDLTIEPKIAIVRRILVDLDLVVWYGIAIRIILYVSRKFW